MITAKQVREVARTARPCQVGPDLEMTIDYVVKHTTGPDWDGDLYQLGDTAATELAAQFNTEHGLVVRSPAIIPAARRRRLRAIPATAQMKG